MRTGRLVERLIVRSATPSSDGQGGTSATPVVVATIPAEEIPQNATELLQAESVASHARYQFRIRARGDITPGMTASWTPRRFSGAATFTLQILGVLPGQPGEMHLTCAAVH